MINPFPVVLAELRRTRLGTAAAIAMVAVAVALGVAVTAQERALRRGSSRAADPFDLLVGARGSPTQLVLAAVYLQPASLDLVPGAVLGRLGRERGVAWLSPLVFGDSYRGHPVVGASADLVTLGGRRRLAEGRVFETAGEVVVGFDVGLRPGDGFEAAHGHAVGRGEDDADVHRGFRYRVVGRLPRTATPWDRAIVAPVEAIWRVHARPSGHRGVGERIGPPWDADEVPGVSAAVVAPASVADAYRLRARYRDGETMAVFPAEVLVELYALLGDVRGVLALVAGLTQALVVAAVLLAVLAAEAQRQRQLGVLRALGASRGYVLAAVWSRVVILIAGGGALGLGLGVGMAWALSALFEARTGIAAPVTLTRTELGLVALVIASGSALALVPGWRVYRRRLSSLLRG